MAQVKKITVAGVWGRIDPKEVLNAKAPITVMRVMGMAMASKLVPTPFGESTCLLGSFEATNPVTGEISTASQLYLPEVALIPIMTAMGVENSRGVQFAIELQVAAAQNKKPGGSVYEYTFSSLIPPAENDPLQAIRNAVQKAAPALPPPTKKPEEVKRGPGRPPVKK